MKKQLFLLWAFLFMFFLSACNGANNISVDKNSISFPIGGGEENVSVTADGSWSVKDCPDWVTTETQEGMILIRTARNETGAPREGDIVLAGKDDVTATIHVKQATKCTHITPASDKVEFEKEGGTQTIAIDTDGSPQIEAPEGFTATYDNGTLSVTAPANEAGSKRGEIKLTCEDQSATIYATQKGNVCQRCGGSGKITCPKCNGKGLVHVYVAPEMRDIVGSEQPCEKCGGNWDGTTDAGSVWRKGSGRIKCPDCGGTGQ